MDGRKKQHGHRRFQVETLWNTHHEITRLALMGMKSIDIATHMGLSPVTVSYTLNSPIVRRQLEQMQAVRDLGCIDIAKQIAELAPRAVAVLETMLDNELPNVALKAAESILDRAGFAAVQRIKQDISISHFSAGEIADIKNRAKDVGLLLEAEYIEVPRQLEQASAAG